MSSHSPLVGVVSPCRNRRDKTARFVERLRRQSYRNFRLYLVDSASSDGTPEYIRRFFPEVTLIQADDSKFWTGATNVGVRQALADGCQYILTINDDSVIEADFLGLLVAQAEAHRLDIVAPRIEYLDQPGLLWSAGAWNDWRTGKLFQLQDSDQWADEAGSTRGAARLQRVETLCGNGVLVRRDVYAKAGLYDERWFPHYHADSEFILRAARAGFGVWLTTRTVLFNDISDHREAAARKPKKIPPRVAPGDFGSLLRRWGWDGRDHLWSIRSPWYWRPWLMMTLRHCPLTRKPGCFRGAVRQLWKACFRESWQVWRGQHPASRPLPKPAVPPYPAPLATDAGSGRRTHAALNAEALDELWSLEDEEFTPAAYLHVLGREMDEESTLPHLLERPDGRRLIIRSMLDSPEGRLTGVPARVSPLARRFLNVQPGTAQFAAHSVVALKAEDYDELDAMPPMPRVEAAYRRLLQRDPDAQGAATQLAASRQGTPALLRGMIGSAEFRMRRGHVSNLVTKRLNLSSAEVGPQTASPAPDILHVLLGASEDELGHYLLQRGLTEHEREQIQRSRLDAAEQLLGAGECRQAHTPERIREMRALLRQTRHR